MKNNNAKKLLQVIGIGNRLMGDDGIGVYVVEELLTHQFLYSTDSVTSKINTNAENTEDTVLESDIIIEYVIGETDFDYCLDCIKKEGFVIIIDSAMAGKEPGTVSKFKINDLSLCTSIMLSVHNQNLIETVSMNMKNCEFAIFGIEPEIVDYRWGLSDTLETALPHIVEEIKKCILELAKHLSSISAILIKLL